MSQRIDILENENGNLRKENVVLKKELKQLRADFQEEQAARLIGLQALHKDDTKIEDLKGYTDLPLGRLLDKIDIAEEKAICNPDYLKLVKKRNTDLIDLTGSATDAIPSEANGEAVTASQVGDGRAAASTYDDDDIPTETESEQDTEDDSEKDSSDAEGGRAAGNDTTSTDIGDIDDFDVDMIVD